MTATRVIENFCDEITNFLISNEVKEFIEEKLFAVKCVANVKSGVKSLEAMKKISPPLNFHYDGNFFSP